MAVKKILLFGEPILKEVATPITKLDTKEDIQEIIDDLKDTLHHGKMWAKGVALAAPQIGHGRRVIYFDYGELKNLIMINPEVLEATGRMKHNEMCLSVPKAFKRKIRKSYMRVSYQDENLNKREKVLTGMNAVVFQHELDHLDGKMITDEGR